MADGARFGRALSRRVSDESTVPLCRSHIASSIVAAMNPCSGPLGADAPSFGVGCLTVTQVLPSGMLEVRYYLASNGSSPFADWFAEVDAAARAKITVAIARMGQGNLSNVKSVGGGVLEYKIDFGPG
jgi:hypothetical protein